MTVQDAICLRNYILEGIAFSEVEYRGKRYKPTSFEGHKGNHVTLWPLPDMDEPIIAPASQCVLTQPWPIPPPRLLRKPSKAEPSERLSWLRIQLNFPSLRRYAKEYVRTQFQCVR